MSLHEGMVVEAYKLCFLVTSDSVVRGEKKDAIRNIADRLNDFCEGARLESYEVVGNDQIQILKRFFNLVDKCDVVVVTGGTGLSSRDRTIEALRGLAEKELPGFGELFRYLSFKEIGLRAALTRAMAFSYRKRLVFVIPGSPHAVELALKELICRIAPHGLYELRR